jgi:alkylresorcinol/alkylpyrone synthase
MSAKSRLRAIATALPPHRLPQIEARQAVELLFAREPEMRRLLPVFENAGVHNRRVAVPLEWLMRPHGWVERNRRFAEHAVVLGTDAATACLARAGIAASEVDAIVAVSSTGIITPGIDVRVGAALGLRPDCERLPLFGLGCAGGVLGLARAARLAEARPGSKILVIAVELCSLAFRINDTSKANIVATALFGDGAAAALVSTSGPGIPVLATGEHTWSNTLDVMGWRIEDDGFGVLFASAIPDLVRDKFAPALEGFLARNAMRRSDIRNYALHPGGAKVIAALEAALDVPQRTLACEREILSEFGNMSAPTIFFVLERVLGRNPVGPILAAALGPGFSAGFLVLGP